MASGGVFSGSLSLSSDQVFDRNCTACEEDNTVSEAVCYCKPCYKYYCAQCRDVHNKIHRDHRNKLLDGAAMLKSLPTRPAPRVALTTMCEEHSDKLVEMYCPDHDIVCCTVCLAIYHKKCTKADYVPKIADGFSKLPDVAKTKSNLQKIRNDLKAIKSSRNNDQTRNKKEKEHVLAQLKESRRRMNAVFDKLEVSVIAGADSRYQSSNIKIQTDLKACDAAINKIETSIKDIEDTDKLNEAQMFVHVKTGEQNMDEWRIIVTEIKDKIGKEKIEFRVNDDIQKYLDQLDTLGKFVDEYTESGPSRTMHRANIRGKPGTSVDTLKGTSKPRMMVRKEDVTVKMKEDSYMCSIRGSCCLPDGGTLLSDYNNDKLKLMNSKYQITDSCSHASPRGVCYIQRSHEAAVCVGGAIQIVSLGRTMKVVRSIKMADVDCYGVAYCNGLLYVSENCGIKLYVYEYATGQLSRTVDTDTHEKMIFSNTKHIATNADGTRIWVADYDNGLIELDKHGNVIRVVKIDEMDYTIGVCVDNEDNVYVCGEIPENVLQLTSNGEKVSTLLREDELPGDPRSVSYDNTRSRLLVTMFNTNSIKVIHFK